MERTKTDLNWDADVAIDQSALDVEWLEQAPLMMKYGRHMAECKNTMDFCKEQMDAMAADLDFRIRENPAKFGLAKLTEPGIKQAVLLAEEYHLAQADYSAARNEYEMAKVALNAIECRKTALENLVKLHGQMYFAGPSVPRDLDKAWVEREKEKRVNAGIKITPRTK